MKFLFRALSPLFLGVVMFNCIRFTTDLLRYEIPWSSGPMKYHLFALCTTIVMCYAFDFASRYFLSRVRPKLKISVVSECMLIILNLLVVMNLIMFVGDRLGVLYMGNIITDYVVANVIYIPLFLIYYIILRTNQLETDYHRQTLQLEKIRTDQLEMELKFLKSQYHPHFLFNVLNTIYFQIDEKNKEPRRTIEMLSELLRYQLYSEDNKVLLEQEFDYLNTYIALQKLRANERLELNTFFDPSLQKYRVSPLLLLPLLENAFKYVGGDYKIDITARKEKNGLFFSVTNSIPPSVIQTRKRAGIGLDNLRRRLALLYPGKHTLEISKEDNIFVVKLFIVLEDAIC
ncbi:sensor histidine kinase [Parabacteroides chinchillae]|uniref:Histidine kinase n=1 Tax=Parabacteroides chinchillae TaxID=871327 RepID=A0A8G2FBN1_9BACT|nr:histidine kinase [Parabacteroides chinchillae]SEG11146.1 Histidine kinase [Parabacteroides chinchillae]